ncbi:hypothetical protein [Marivirga arenosa]|uniref:Uncharacterized protein n=1 Tax=Marivirga arenosa TaxID=3059076 RepID=A0AA52F067_9BACT|nr:hypothetical protein [Marivirga sp. BKB1-2]WNB18023.1 hypothetical protein QYS47_28910 [Marivirga sp. BKB1-2]
MWYGEQTETGAKMILNELMPPAADKGKISCSFRNRLLSLPDSSWKRLWPLIKSRVDYDDFFWVQGLPKKLVSEAMERLEIIFPYEWIEKQFKTYLNKTEVDFAADLPQSESFWYPSYHLARTALGAICVDPAWNYLIELAKSIDNLNGFPKVDQITRSITKQPGNQHHLCYASEFHDRNMLIELEPLIGKGSAKNDLQVEYKGERIDIELKAFSSKTPETRIKKEIIKKLDQLPNELIHPLIFHLVIIENGQYDKEQEANFLNTVRSLEDSFLGKIHAVVAGRMFVDSSGGFLKRDFKEIRINSTSKFDLNEKSISEIFKPNFNEIKYPIYGIGSFFQFANESQ